MERRGAFYSGTSNILLPIKQSQFPPEYAGASRLTYYASLYSSVEINSTFYKLPKRVTVEKWSESVPAAFRFTCKVSKAVTHAKDLQFEGSDLEAFIETVAGAGNKKGCLLVQFPPSVKSDKVDSLEAILETLSSEAKGWHIAVEFRHNSWYNSSIYRVLKHYGAGMVEQDMPLSATPDVTVSKEFSYLRFHGPDGSYRSTYDDAALLHHAKRITAWLGEGREVYAYFNNTMGDALGNLNSLNAMVDQQLATKGKAQ